MPKLVKKEDDQQLSILCHRVLSEISGAVCITDSKHKILFSNKLFRRYFGVGKGDHFKKICRSAKEKKKCAPILGDKKAEIEIDTCMPTKHFSLIHTPLKVAGTTYYIEELRDTTKLRKSERTLKDYTEKLELELKKRTDDLREEVRTLEDERSALMSMMSELNEAYQKLEEEAIKKDELFNITSHELKTPLVPISGFTDMLLEDKKDLNKKQKEYLSIIKGNVVRLKSLLENIINIAKIEARTADFNIRNNNISKILTDSIKESNPFAKKRYIKILPDIPPAIRIRCDKEKIHGMMRQLLDNAIKFSKDDKTISISLRKGKQNATISVADQGIGISAQNKERIFDKFFQGDSSLDREAGGAGLGLSICKAVVESHRGELWVESVAKKGSTFYVRLPLKLKSPKLKSYKDNDETVEALKKEMKRIQKERLDLMTQV